MSCELGVSRFVPPGRFAQSSCELGNSRVWKAEVGGKTLAQATIQSDPPAPPSAPSVNLGTAERMLTIRMGSESSASLGVCGPGQEV